MNKKVAICGHFGFGKDLLNGQTIKTKIITNELEEKLGKLNVEKIDTHDGLKRLPIIFLKSFKAFIKSQDIIIMPATNGLKVIVPMYFFLNVIFRKKLHYIVIGGWLDKYLNKHKFIEKMLKKFRYIYIETTSTKKKLEKRGFENLCIMPNCKKLEIINSNDIVYYNSEPYKVCIFSRIVKEKGVEDAIDVVKSINEMYQREILNLDLYGSIDKEYEQEFLVIKKNLPSYIKYCGEVNYAKTVQVIKNYFLLLFPTKFYTEGIPGTVIDALSSGVPVVASKWENVSDIIEDGKCGYVYEFNNKEEFKKVLLKVIDNPELVNNIKINCIDEAKKYMVENVVQKCIKLK